MTVIPTTTTGPVRIDSDLTAGDITIISEARTNTQIEADPDAITVTEHGQTISVRAKGGSGHGGGTIITGGRGVSVVSTGSGTIITGDCVTVNGVMIGTGVSQVNYFGGGGASHISFGGSAPVVTVRVPIGSTIQAKSRSGDINTDGPIDDVRATSISGSIRVAHTNHATISTTSGDIDIENLAGDASAQSVSGDVTIHSTASGRVTAQTVSGDVTITKDPGVDVDADTRSVSGRSRVR